VSAGVHRPRRLVRVAIPAVVASALVASAASAQSAAHPPRAAADVHPYASPQPLEPFDATPTSVPFPTPSAYAPQAAAIGHRQPPATSPVTRFPRDLHAVAGAIPLGALAAYVNAARMTDESDPQCQLRWQVLAGIGFIESDNARSGGSANPRWNGIAVPPIYGPLLDGRDGFGRIPDTDHGAVDGDSRWDRAVGPMQFLPSTWAVYGVDADGDGVANPQDINDSALAAGHYLCAASPLLAKPVNLVRAIHAYNHSFAYVRAVLTVTASYMGINPSKLGINGLPTSHLADISIAVGSLPGPAIGGRPTTTPTSSPTATPDPGASTPTPASTPAPSAPTRGPVRRPSPSPSPTPTPSAPPRLPEH
jgi:membrane-bound lytic murein transglycosylase B